MANQSHGFDVTIGIGREATYATKATAFKWPGIVESFDPSESQNTDQRRSIGVRGPFMMRYGAKNVDASIDAALQNARLLYAALGYVADAGATGEFVHTIRPVRAGEELPSFTIQLHDANLNNTTNYLGGKVDKMTLTATAEEAVEVSVDWIFKDGDVEAGAAAVVAAELNNYFMFYEGVMKINGDVVSNVTEFEVEIANNIEARFAIAGERTLQRLEEGHLEISASINFDMTDNAQYGTFLAGDPVEVELILQDIDNANHSIVVKLVGGLYDTNEAGVSAEDQREQEMELVFTDMEIIATDDNATLF